MGGFVFNASGAAPLTDGAPLARPSAEASGATVNTSGVACGAPPAAGFRIAPVVPGTNGPPVFRGVGAALAEPFNGIAAVRTRGAVGGGLARPKRGRTIGFEETAGGAAVEESAGVSAMAEGAAAQRTEVAKTGI